MLEGRGNACLLDRREQPRPCANPDPARSALPFDSGSPGKPFCAGSPERSAHRRLLRTRPRTTEK
eukprot:2190749-Pyramimonas_sp.AAC.1